LVNAVHIGRFDKSKRIDEIINAIHELRIKGLAMQLRIVGSPSNPKAKEYQNDVLRDFGTQEYREWITFLPSIKRSDIAELLMMSDIFVHSFIGSLDKVVLEATLVGIPVVSINQEFLNEFGAWGDPFHPTIGSELEGLLTRDFKDINSEVLRRQNLVLEQHTQSSWALKIYNVISA
jgi:glycosyltransferase involved in cell wall biosynthesis